MNGLAQDLTQPSRPLLSVRDLSVSIHGAALLRDVSLEIAAGETLALTGESGSGKSLTALAAIGLLPGTARASGSVAFNGSELLTTPERALCALRGRDVAMVFQEPMTALNPLMTIGDQISETFRIHRRRGGARAVRGLLARVGLDLPPTRYPHELSGGQRQRVAIAMAIALGPKLLIADEPTTALDVTTQAQVLELLRTLSREDGMALMLISHDLAVVGSMADRIAVMHEGRIVETGPSADILHRPTHDYTRALLEASRHRTVLPPAAPPPPDASGPLLKVERLSLTYPRPRKSLFRRAAPFKAVRDVSFSIERGERVGLVGESGCGKSTLTRALLGLHPVAGGRICLDGAPLGPAPSQAVRRKVQVVFQDPYGSFNPRHRVSRLLAEPLSLLERPPTGQDRRAVIAEALRDVGLSPDDAGKHIHAFSGGQRQRLAIARALIIRPALIVLDEAVSALDVRVRAQVLDLLAGLSESHQLTWLFISHDLSVVRSVTDRVLVMRAGQIVEEGPTERLFSAPAEPYTQALLSAVPKLPDAPATE